MEKQGNTLQRGKVYTFEEFKDFAKFWFYTFELRSTKDTPKGFVSVDGKFGGFIVLVHPDDIYRLVFATWGLSEMTIKLCQDHAMDRVIFRIQETEKDMKIKHTIIRVENYLYKVVALSKNTIIDDNAFDSLQIRDYKQ